MPTEAEIQQQKMKEFMQLLPLTLEIAGLPKGEPGRLFTDGQIEVRVGIIRNAYKQARQLLMDIARPAEG